MKGNSNNTYRLSPKTLEARRLAFSKLRSLQEYCESDSPRGAVQAGRGGDAVSENAALTKMLQQDDANQSIEDIAVEDEVVTVLAMNDDGALSNLPNILEEDDDGALSNLPNILEEDDDDGRELGGGNHHSFELKQADPAHTQLGRCRSDTVGERIGSKLKPLVEEKSRSASIGEINLGSRRSPSPNQEERRPMKEAVTVAVRIRPLSQAEVKAGELVAWSTVENGNSIRGDTSMLSARERQKASRDFLQYTYDFVFDKNATNNQVHGAFGRSIVRSVYDGINGTIFAYGQTASGKTHTILGDEEEPGVTPLAIHDLFHLIDKSHSRSFLVRCSYMEVYNEQVDDLLDPANKDLNIYEEKAKGTVSVPKLTETVVSKAEEVMLLIERGMANRRIGVTKMNSRSSRSHAIFRIIVESRLHHQGIHRATSFVTKWDKSESTSAVRIATLNIIDLAGSEKSGKQNLKGRLLSEGVNINKSLLCLGQVISALSSGKTGAHVPYRGSKLTRLLAMSLGGNSRTVVLVACSPAVSSWDETVSSLRFATRAKKVVNSTKMNEIHTKDSLIHKYEERIKKLEKMLVKTKDPSVPESAEEDNVGNQTIRRRSLELRSALHQEQQKRDEAQEQLEAMRSLILKSSANHESVDKMLTRAVSTATLAHLFSKPAGSRLTHNSRKTMRRISIHSRSMSSKDLLSNIQEEDDTSHVAAAARDNHAVEDAEDAEDVKSIEDVEEEFSLPPMVLQTEHETIIREHSEKSQKLEAEKEALAAQVELARSRLEEKSLRVEQLLQEKDSDMSTWSSERRNLEEKFAERESRLLKDIEMLEAENADMKVLVSSAEKERKVWETDRAELQAEKEKWKMAYLERQSEEKHLDDADKTKLNLMQRELAESNRNEEALEAEVRGLQEALEEARDEICRKEAEEQSLKETVVAGSEVQPLRQRLNDALRELRKYKNIAQKQQLRAADLQQQLEDAATAADIQNETHISTIKLLHAERNDLRSQ
eukprot:g5071.t1